MVVFYAFGYAVAAQNAVEHPVGAIEAKVLVGAQKGVDETHMIGIIVDQKHPGHPLHVNAIPFKRGFDDISLYAGIDYDTSPGSADIAAVAA